MALTRSMAERSRGVEFASLQRFEQTNNKRGRTRLELTRPITSRVPSQRFADSKQGLHCQPPYTVRWNKHTIIIVKIWQIINLKITSFLRLISQTFKIVCRRLKLRRINGCLEVRVLGSKANANLRAIQGLNFPLTQMILCRSKAIFNPALM
jgi:hypothetical protein